MALYKKLSRETCSSVQINESKVFQMTEIVLSELQLLQQRQFANRRRGPRGLCCFGPRGLRRRFANQRRSL